VDSGTLIHRASPGGEANSARRISQTDTRRKKRFTKTSGYRNRLQKHTKCLSRDESRRKSSAQHCITGKSKEAWPEKPGSVPPTSKKKRVKRGVLK